MHARLYELAMPATKGLFEKSGSGPMAEGMATGYRLSRP